MKVPAGEEGEGGGGGRLILSCNLVSVSLLLFGLLAVLGFTGLLALFPDPTGSLVCGLSLVGLGLDFVVVTGLVLTGVVLTCVVLTGVVSTSVGVSFVFLLPLALTDFLTFPALPSLPRLSAAASSEVRLLATALSARLFLAFISSGVAAGYLKAFSLAKLDSDSTLERSGANSACPEAGEPLSCVFFCSGSR